jgi:nicotinate-nucleotide--dimethylbenzimidazole phosphoribosyltransferase
MKAPQFNLIEETARAIVPADTTWREKAKAHIKTLTMPPWALGRLLDLAVDLAGMTRSLNPPIERRAVVVMAGDHGVVSEGVSAYSNEVTVQMIHNFARGGAGVNVLSELAKARVIVVDVGVAGNLDDLVKSGAVHSRRIASGTQNIARGPAMSRVNAIRSIEVGIRMAKELSSTTDLFATGEMGIGNTTPSSAIVSVLCDIAPEFVTGCGTGIDEVKRAQKAKIIARSLDVNCPNIADPIDILSKVGGYEISAIAGLILGCAAEKKPVLVDGFISTAAALVAQKLCILSTDYMIASHQSVEPGHRIAWAKLGQHPLLDLGRRNRRCACHAPCGSRPTHINSHGYL